MGMNGIMIRVFLGIFLSVADLSATDYGIAVECSLSICVCVSGVSTIKILWSFTRIFLKFCRSIPYGLISYGY